MKNFSKVSIMLLIGFLSLIPINTYASTVDTTTPSTPTTEDTSISEETPTVITPPTIDDITIIEGIPVNGETPIIEEEVPDVESGDNHGINEELTSEGTDFEFIYEDYIEVTSWDLKSTPIIDGINLKEGWFKFENLYYKVENGEITREKQMFPTNYNASKGVGNLHIKFNLETLYTTPLGIVIKSIEEGVQVTKVLSDFNQYEAYLNYLPAGNYFIALIYDDNFSQKLPINKILDYQQEFVIAKDKTMVLDIFSKEYYEENGQTTKVENMTITEEVENIESESENDIIIKEVVEDIPEKSNRLILNIIMTTFLSIIGFIGYKAYKHIK